ncbi:MAG: hypothetical protein K0U41_06495 [Gammaproteobacteria bacterium]|nr:hypothetical protein [Gammaproteobacteria bacterium]
MASSDFPKDQLYECRYPDLAEVFFSPNKIFKDFQNRPEYAAYMYYTKLLNSMAKLLNKPLNFPNNDKIMILYFTHENALFVKRLEEYEKLCFDLKLIDTEIVDKPLYTVRDCT